MPWVWVLLGILTYIFIGGVLARVNNLSILRTCSACQNKKCEEHLGTATVMVMVIFWGPVLIFSAPYFLCIRTGDVVDKIVNRKELAAIQRQIQHQQYVETAKEFGLPLIEE